MMAGVEVQTAEDFVGTVAQLSPQETPCGVGTFEHRALDQAGAIVSTGKLQRSAQALPFATKGVAVRRRRFP